MGKKKFELTVMHPSSAQNMARTIYADCCKFSDGVYHFYNRIPGSIYETVTVACFPIAYTIIESETEIKDNGKIIHNETVLS